MQAPIARKIQRNPKDFLLKITKPSKPSNLYTFNQPSSLFDSNYKQNAQLVEQQNPEVDLQTDYKQKQQEAKSKIYFDVEEQNGREGENLSSLRDSHQYRSNLQFKMHEVQTQYKVNTPEPPTLSPLHPYTGSIIKQRLSHDKTSTPKSQRQFNRLALSLLGVKRTKYNQSCLQKRSSPSVQQLAETRYHGLREHQSYNDRKKGMSSGKERYHAGEEADETGIQIYQHSMYPFPVRKIEGLKKDINRISEESRLRRNYGYEQNNDEFERLQKQQKKQVKPYGEIYCEQSLEQLKITIKTSLSSLKNLLSQNLNKKKINIELPAFFLRPPSQLKIPSSFDPQILNNQCTHVFTSLQIPIVNINIRKYSNCLVVVNHNICIVWHQGKFGKRYLGGWKNKYFDQGEKEGMGVQWAPARYVYYGQFKGNKRNGFGVMKKNDQSLILGFWKNGKHQHFGIEKNYVN